MASPERASNCSQGSLPQKLRRLANAKVFQANQLIFPLEPDRRTTANTLLRPLLLGNQGPLKPCLSSGPITFTWQASHVARALPPTVTSP